MRVRREIFRIRKDGGQVVTVRLHRGPRVGASLRVEGNERVAMSCAPDAGELVASSDPQDAAHGIRNNGDTHAGDARYMPAATLHGRDGRYVAFGGRVYVWVTSARPRQYHPSQLNSHRSEAHPHGCTPDQVADALYEAQTRLEGVTGLGVDARRVTQSVTCELAARSLGVRKFRKLLGDARAGLEPGELSAEELEAAYGANQ